MQTCPLAFATRYRTDSLTRTLQSNAASAGNMRLSGLTFVDQVWHAIPHDARSPILGDLDGLLTDSGTEEDVVSANDDLDCE